MGTTKFIISNDDHWTFRCPRYASLISEDKEKQGEIEDRDIYNTVSIESLINGSNVKKKDVLRSKFGNLAVSGLGALKGTWKKCYSIMYNMVGSKLSTIINVEQIKKLLKDKTNRIGDYCTFLCPSTYSRFIPEYVKVLCFKRQIAASGANGCPIKKDVEKFVGDTKLDKQGSNPTSPINTETTALPKKCYAQLAPDDYTKLNVTVEPTQCHACHGNHLTDICPYKGWGCIPRSGSLQGARKKKVKSKKVNVPRETTAAAIEYEGRNMFPTTIDNFQFDAARKWLKDTAKCSWCQGDHPFNMCPLKSILEHAKEPAPHGGEHCCTLLLTYGFGRNIYNKKVYAKEERTYLVADDMDGACAFWPI